MRASLFFIVFFVFSSFTDKPELERAALLGELNYARLQPALYSASIGISLKDHWPVGKLTWDNQLGKKAQRYAEFLLENRVLQHSQMGYPESILWCYDVNNAVKQFIIDEDVPDLSHRIHLLDGKYTRAGIGVSTGWVGRWERTYVVILTR